MINLVFSLLLLLIAFPMAFYGGWRAFMSFGLMGGKVWIGRRSHQLVLVDWLALFVLLQLPLCLVAAVLRDQDSADMAIYVWAWIYTLTYVGIWWWGATTLSTLRIHSTLRRVVYLAVLQPIGVILLVVGLFVLALTPMGVLGGMVMQSVQCFGALFAFGVAAWLFACACDWVRAGSELLTPSLQEADDSA